MPDCNCAIIQALGAPRAPVRTATGGTVQLLGCRQHVSEILGPYTLGLGYITGSSIGHAYLAGADEARELVAAASDILKAGAHEDCTAIPGEGCREHLRTYDRRAERLRAALAAIVARSQ